ncbi:MAG: transporter substrate-binding domain-containing protein [Campylobacterales bacterium]|nr:transporter substrate-binding domain-containing protein [Campylobacterales bacterium]
MRVFLFLLALLIVFWAEPIRMFQNHEFLASTAQENTLLTSLTLEEKEFLAHHPTIPIGMDTQWAPFEFQENGIQQGYSMDILRRIEQSLGIRFEPVTKDQWSDTFALFEQGKIPALSMIAPTKERETFTLFGPPTLQANLALALPKTTTQVTSFEQLFGKKIGVIASYWYIPLLQEEYPPITLVTFPSVHAAFQGLLEGKIDGYLDIQPVLHYYLNRYFSHELKISLPLQFPYQSLFNYHIGVHKDSPLLRSILDKALHALSPQTILNLQQKWIGDTLSPTLSKQLLMGPNVQHFLSDLYTLKLGIDTSWPPFDFVDAAGRHRGIVKEIIDVIFLESLGITPLPITTPKWKQHIDAIEAYEIDVISGIVKSEERAQKMLFTKPYLTMPLMVLGRLDGKSIDSLKDIEGETVGIVNGYVTREILHKYPSITPRSFPDLKSGLIALSRGEIEYFFDGLAAMNYTIRTEGITNLKLLGQTGENYALSFGVRKDWPELVEALDYVIETTPQQTINHILSPWIRMDVQSTIDYSLAWKSVVIFTFIIVFIVYWNRRLRAEILRRERVEEQLFHAQLRAEKANQAKSEFLSNMSHEIRTPMNAVIGFAELTAKMDLPPKALHNIHTIQKSAKALVGLINDILDLSKIEAGKVDIRREVVNIATLAEDLHAIFSLRAKHKNIYFETIMHPSTPKALILDELRVRQILVNLIGNAVKFTHEGGVKVCFNATPNPQRDSTIDLHVKVEDTGIGILEAEQEKIFGMFEQQSRHDNRAYEGTGLGLAISKKFAELMDGVIHVTSMPEKGSTFTLTLAHVEIAASLPVHAAYNTSHTLHFAPAKVLVVDDVTENLELLRDILDTYKLGVITTHSGEEAIHLAEEERPDLILMDIKMPQVDGCAASKAIRNNVLTAHIPIIAVSASVLGEKEEAKKGSFDGFIPKPIDIVEFETMLTRFLPHEQEPLPAPLNTSPKNALFSLPSNAYPPLLKKAKEALDSGDFDVVKELIFLLEAEHGNEALIQKLTQALDHIDIDILEIELTALIRFLEEGTGHDI